MINKLFKAKLYLLLLSLFLVVSVSAQTETPKTESVKTAKKVMLKSKLMGREMPYNLLLPKNYEDRSQKDTRYPVIYLFARIVRAF